MVCRWYHGLIIDVILDWGAYFSSERRVRALYDPFLHGFGRHIGSEVWVSFALGPLGRYPYHHSHLIGDLL